MSIKEQFNAKKNATLRELKRATEVELREANTELQVYFGDELQSASAKNFKPQKKVPAHLTALKNTTDKLYNLYGNLRRALIAKQTGNITEYKASGDVYYNTLGIDITATVRAGGRTVSLVYAIAHELGGTRTKARPYFYPAIKKYIANEMNNKLHNIVAQAARTFNE